MTKTQEQTKFIKGEIVDVVVYKLKKYPDERGWLAELFRHDDLNEEFFPVMSYISFTKPGVQRGPHEHVDQADLFCFIGPSTFNIRLWDNRPDSPTYNNMMSLDVGELRSDRGHRSQGRGPRLQEHRRGRWYGYQLPKPPVHGRRQKRADRRDPARGRSRYDLPDGLRS